MLGAGSSLVGVQDLVCRVTVTEGKVKADPIYFIDRANTPPREVSFPSPLPNLTAHRDRYPYTDSPAVRDWEKGLVGVYPVGD